VNTLCCQQPTYQITYHCLLHKLLMVEWTA